ncbi:MAG: dTMP kinase [Caldisericaceae bacterium]|jgi:dTMP kinase|nr:dTMP kinase [Caldisericaceae bacterium]
MKKGIFITLEGIDGCGKTTQAKLLKKFFEEKGFKVVLTREPGGSSIGPEVRNILLNKNMNPVSEFLLFASDRKEHIKGLIKPALERGEVVISDRFCDSSVAYQGYGRGVSLDFINYVHNFILEGLLPDITLLFDVSPEVGLKRIHVSDRIEGEGAEFLKKVRNGYLEIAKREKRFAIINGEKSKDKVYKDMVSEILGRGLIYGG